MVQEEAEALSQALSHILTRCIPDTISPVRTKTVHGDCGIMEALDFSMASVCMDDFRLDEPTEQC